MRLSPFLQIIWSHMRQKLFFSERPEVIYAVGDVHGCLDLLHILQDKIQADAARETGAKWIVMLGDYVDRGPKSSAVLEELITTKPDGMLRFAWQETTKNRCWISFAIHIGIIAGWSLVVLKPCNHTAFPGYQTIIDNYGPQYSKPFRPITSHLPPASLRSSQCPDCASCMRGC